MKKIAGLLIILAALGGCEDASNTFEKAQQAAKTTVDGLQEQIKSVDLSKINLDQFGDAAASAKALMESIEKASDINFTDTKALNDTLEQVEAAYEKLVDLTSESRAEALMDKLLDAVPNEETRKAIENSLSH
ncbi:MAG: hypothetical protein LPH21_01820 [Shewanella sp.]|nr:hypothetical protein [Shewanella sp.]MCF1431637.1 hypothetical protein [Shewanella sp.]MCF1456340.1 hypothetical protein [Shewanella sp.]